METVFLFTKVRKLENLTGEIEPEEPALCAGDGGIGGSVSGWTGFIESEMALKFGLTNLPGVTTTPEVELKLVEFWLETPRLV
jgi:hypothetical protein